MTVFRHIKVRSVTYRTGADGMQVQVSNNKVQIPEALSTLVYISSYFKKEHLYV